MSHRIATAYVEVSGHDLWVLDCWKCGVIYAIPTAMERTRTFKLLAAHMQTKHKAHA
jgi:hypothetical protein